MSKINNTNRAYMSDVAIMTEIGSYIRHNRLEQNKSQAQLAKDAGIDRTTLVEFEHGKRGNLMTLIKLLRALTLLQVLQVFEVNEELSPMQLAELDMAKRKRASKVKQTRKGPKSDW